MHRDESLPGLRYNAESYFHHAAAPFACIDLFEKMPLSALLEDWPGERHDSGTNTDPERLTADRRSFNARR
jgi:hypothetical protein